ncbi:isopentenyldiphosphate isomerase [Peribacillus deserti]|uniref:Isopentenyldiphosphate isomerase n=1 Tax=Peribacillus deserti TaxID=673318 RepID=A0ABS2QCP8_9BACI|nr:NUDIX domain-containing protein [Peribacillus deserti]MBM7690935.1 isopentenyldiphosphate isomerase [Peribacillus deserti]
METELLAIYDDDGNRVGAASRSDVHKAGYWHQAIHCWFISNEEDADYVYFQKRSAEKKDYPNLFDITAAGHLLAHETIEDGVREIQEELGIEVSIDDLTKLGVIKYCVIKEDIDFIDKEIAAIFLYHCSCTLEEFKLQKEEVSGIVRAEFTSFYEYCMGEKDSIFVEGFEFNLAGQKADVSREVHKQEFVTHDHFYYPKIAEMISKNLRQR